MSEKLKVLKPCSDLASETICENVARIALDIEKIQFRDISRPDEKCMLQALVGRFLPNTQTNFAICRGRLLMGLFCLKCFFTTLLTERAM